MIIKKTKKFKKLILIFFLDANARVFDTYLQELFSILRHDLNLNGNISFPRELDSIALDAQQNLHDPLFIGDDQRSVGILILIKLIVTYIREIDFEFNFLF